MRRLGFIVLVLVALTGSGLKAYATPIKQDCSNPNAGPNGGKESASTGDGDEPYITQAAPPPSQLRDVEPNGSAAPMPGSSAAFSLVSRAEQFELRIRDALRQLVMLGMPRTSGWRPW